MRAGMPAVSFVQAPVAEQTERTRTEPVAQPAAFQAALARAAKRVEPAHTPLSGDQAASALSDAYRTVTGRTPTAKQLSLLTAQWSLETGGGRAMMNHNFGGIKGTGPSGLSTAYTTKEGYGATERTIVDRFRAYRTPTEGAEDYLRTLRARFPHSFDAVRAGDPSGFAHALKREGYYTGSEADYSRAIASMSERALSHGFGTLGHSGVSSGASVAVAPPDADFGDGSLRALDALEIADQMSRAALQIAGRDKERETL